MNELLERIANAFSDPDSLATLWESIRAAVQEPSANLPAALMLAAIAGILLLLVVLSLVFLLGGRGEVEYVYMDADEVVGDEYEVVETAAATPEVDEAVTVFREGTARGARRPVGIGVLALVLGVFAYAIGVGVAGLDSVCTTCHVDTAHVTIGEDETHGRVRCVSCHEQSDPLTLIFIEHPSRLLHVATMGFADDAIAAYGRPSDRSCSVCHRAVVREVIEQPERSVRISHAEFVDLGAPCIECHTLGSDGVVGRNTTGMVECLRCHDDEVASASCSTCHTGEDVSDAAIGRLSRGHEAHGVVPQPQCYTCHDPAPCDSCHGMRLPHETGYAAVHMYDAAHDFWNTGGKKCASCHDTRARSCYSVGCHEIRMPIHGQNAGELAEFGRVHAQDGGCDDCHNRAGAWEDACTMCHRR